MSINTGEKESDIYNKKTLHDNMEGLSVEWLMITWFQSLRL